MHWNACLAFVLAVAGCDSTDTSADASIELPAGDRQDAMDATSDDGPDDDLALDQPELDRSDGPIATPPVAAFGLSENTGATVRDGTGHGLDGTISGAVWAEGRFGSALEFRSPGDVLVITDDPRLWLDRFTIEAWVYPTLLVTGYQSIVAKLRGRPYGLYILDTEPAAWVNTTGGSLELASGITLPIALNRWTHLCATFDGARLRLFVNGEILSSGLAPGGVLRNDPGDLRIGFENERWPFSGRIDEVRLYDRALSTMEIRADMAQPVDP